LGKSYPSFQPSYSHEELVEHFLLTPGELELVLKCRGNVNRCGMALLLKALPTSGACPAASMRFRHGYANSLPGRSACCGIARNRTRGTELLMDLSRQRWQRSWPEESTKGFAVTVMLQDRARWLGN
jgi:Domain of unknown function (DUF4158)